MEDIYKKAAIRVLASMQGEARDTVRALLNGQTQRQVSVATGMPQSVVSYHLRAFQAKVRAEMEEA